MSGTDLVIAIPPLSFFVNLIFGGFWFSLIPNPMHINIRFGRMVIDRAPLTFQFTFDDLLVRHGLGSIQHNQDQIAGTRHTND